jgi:hypothetical protein
MKKLILFLLFATAARATTISLNLSTPGGGVIYTNTSVTFELKNYGNTPPEVVGSFVLVPTTQTYYPNNSGLVSGTITGNDIITPNNTYYSMTFYNSGTAYYTCNVVIVGSFENLNTASCLADVNLPGGSVPDLNFYNNGTFIANEPGVNFIPGNNTILNLINDTSLNRVDITVSSTSVPGGGSAVTVVASNIVQNPACTATASFDTCVNGAVTVLATLSPSGGTVDATGLIGSQLVMLDHVLTGSDTMFVRLLLPLGNISRAANKSFKMFFGSQIIGMGKCFLGATCSSITGTGIADIGITYGGSNAYLQYPVLKDFTILSGTYGGTAAGTGIDFSLAQSGKIDGVFSWAAYPLVIGGVGTPGNSSYNRIDYSDFRAGTATGIGVQLLPGANSNVFTGGSYWGHTGVYYRAYGDTFYGPDLEGAGGGNIGFEAAGNGLHVYDGYWEGITTGVLIDAGVMGTSIINPHPGASIGDNSGNSSNYYFGVTDEAVTYAILPLRFGVQDMFVFGSSGLGNTYNQMYAIRGDKGGIVGIESLFQPGFNRSGYAGHANHLMGFLNAKGITTNGSVNVNALGTPPAPTLTVVGATHTAACPTYYVVGIDWNGNKTLPSTAGTLSGSVCPNILGGTNYIEVVPTLDGVYKWDVLKGTTATSIFTNKLCGGAAGSGTDCPDTGQATTSYSALLPTRDATGDVSLSGALTNHIITHTTAPSVSGSGCSLTSGNDTNGTVAATGIDACVVTFNAVYVAPVCQLTPSATTVVPTVTGLANTYLHFSTAAAGTVYYHCEDVQ